MHQWYDILALTQVDDRLFVSGYARAADLAKSNPAKITAVLCVHQVMDYEQNPNIVYMHVPFNDGETIPMTQFVRCLDWLKFMWNNGHCILIHCAAGISRSVTILAAFMHYVGMCDINKAIDRIKMVRPDAGPAPLVLNSAKKMLNTYPYNQYAQETSTHMSKVIEAIQAERSASAHPDEKCPMRVFLLEHEEDDNTPRHLILCSCSKIMNPLEIATHRDKLIIEPGVNEE